MELSEGTRKLLLLIRDDWKLILILSTLFALYFYYTSTFDFFKKKGIPYMKPIVLLGNMGPRITASKSFHDYQWEIYNHFKGKRYGGMFEGRRPVLYIIDTDLIKTIMIRDFDYFTDRNTLNSAEPKYLSRSLLNLKGSEWKAIRSTMTPVFSSARLKNMLPLLQLCTKQMVEYLKQFDQKDAEMKKTMGHYTLEVIGSCAFGIKCDALTDGNSHFIKVAEKFDYMPLKKRMLIFFLLMFVPKLMRSLRISFLNLESTEELVHILQAAKAERRMTNSQKKDFLQILVDVANTEKTEKGKSEIDLNDDTIDAQCLLFLIAGYETSSTLLAFAIHVLATKPDLQEKLRKHVVEMTEGKEMSYELLSELEYLEAFLLDLNDDTIDAQCLLFLIAGYETSSTLLAFAIHVLATKPDLQEKLRKHVVEMTEGKEMSYELLSELEYLEAFLLETLRIYPPVARVDRVVTKPYQIPNSSVRLAVGDVVAIPIYGVHMDPEHYPDPKEFRPERFMGDEKKNRPSHLFLAFGAGPRNCIGLRLSMISTKMAMVSLLKTFNFTTCPKTEEPVTFDKRALLLKPKAGLWVRIETLAK